MLPTLLQTCGMNVGPLYSCITGDAALLHSPHLNVGSHPTVGWTVYHPIVHTTADNQPSKARSRQLHSGFLLLTRKITTVPMLRRVQFAILSVKNYKIPARIGRHQVTYSKSARDFKSSTGVNTLWRLIRPSDVALSRLFVQTSPGFQDIDKNKFFHLC